MIFKNLPALLTLVAACIVSVITYLYKYELTKALVILLVTVIVFYIIGLSIRSLLNHFLAPKNEENTEEQESGEEGENIEDIKELEEKKSADEETYS